LGVSDDEEDINEKNEKGRLDNDGKTSCKNENEASNEFKNEIENESNEGKTSCKPCTVKENETNENSARDTSLVDELRPLTMNRKRKSAAYEGIEGSELDPPIKKIRKSRRLEEKRLAKSKID
jgi:hypothetical protein